MGSNKPKNTGKFKKTVALAIPVVLLLFASAVLAIPNYLNVQGKLTNINDEAQTGEFNFTFRIYTASSGGTLLWQESKKLNTTGNGYWSTLLGSTTALNLTFSADYYLEVMVSGETLSPRFSLVSSAYSFYAQNVSGGIPCSQITGGSDADYCADSTVGGSAVSGSGTAGTIARFDGTNTIRDANITEDSAGNIVVNRNLSVTRNLSASWIFGNISQSQITGITIPLANASWNGVTGLAFGTNVTFNGVTGLAFGTNVTFNGITISAANITNATFSTASGLVFTFPNNLTVLGNVTATNFTGTILCSNIVGGSDPDYCSDATQSGGTTIPASNVTNATFSSSTGLVFTFPNNLTVTGNLSIDRLVSGWVPQSQITGITIPLVNTSWNGVTGLTFGTNVTFNGVTGLTFGANVTFNGLTISAANVTNATFSTSTGLVFTFPDNLTVTGNLSIDRLVSGWVPQSQITGITIPLSNASWNGVTGLTFGTNVTFNGLTISASNITNATFGSTTGVYTFPNNLTINGNLTLGGLGNYFSGAFIGDGALVHSINASSISQGFLPQSRISGITIPAANVTGLVNGVFSTASSVNYNNTSDVKFGFGTSTVPTNSSFDIKYNVSVSQQNNVANNTWQLFYDTTGTCKSKMGYNGTHFVITNC